MLQIFNKKNIDYEKYKFLLNSCILIEGIIGSGKSTLSKSLTEYLTKIGFNVIYYPEEVNLDILQKFLNDKSSAFWFQLYMLEKRLRIYELAQIEIKKPNTIVIIDRGLIGDYAIATYYNKYNLITSDEFQIYKNKINESVYDFPSYIVYLDVSIETAIERKNKRDRINEKNEYDNIFYTNHKKVYDDVIKTFGNNIINIDWNNNGSINIVLNNIKQYYFSTVSL